MANIMIVDDEIEILDLIEVLPRKRSICKMPDTMLSNTITQPRHWKMTLAILILPYST